MTTPIDANVTGLPALSFTAGTTVGSTSTDGGHASLGATTDAAYSGSGPGGTVIAVVKGILAAIKSVLNVNSSTGAVVPFNNPPAQLAAGADTVLPLTAPARHVLVQNNTANLVVNINFDAPASPGSTAIQPGETFYLDISVATAIHLYNSTGGVNINGSSAGNIIVLCRS